MELLYFLLIGLVAGYLAGLVMKGRGLGVLGNVIVGAVGALIGGKLIGGMLGGGLIGQIAVAFVGAVILLFLISLFKKAA